MLIRTKAGRRPCQRLAVSKRDCLSDSHLYVAYYIAIAMVCCLLCDVMLGSSCTLILFLFFACVSRLGGVELGGKRPACDAVFLLCVPYMYILCMYVCIYLST